MGRLQGSYKWKQTADTVMLEVALKGSSPKGVDVFAAPRYIKINYAPYLLHIDLVEEIDFMQGLAKVVDGTLQLTFKKKKLGMWTALEIPEKSENISKEELRQRRAATIKVREELVKAQEDRNKSRRVEDSRFTTREQMAVDERERSALERKKEEIKAAAEQEVYQAFSKLNPAADTLSVEPARAAQSPPGPAPADPPSSQKSDIFCEEDVVTKASAEESKECEVEEERPDERKEALTFIPAPRRSCQVKVSFTPRVFPTPMRESKKEEEEDWLLRNRRHLNQRMQKKLEGVDISERDPFWLKGKGDDFFTAKDYSSAINAYNCALEINPDYTPVLSNRAACYLQIEDYDKCIQDCTTAIAQCRAERNERTKVATEQGLPPPKDLRREVALWKKLHIRRGTAYCCKHDYAKGLTDYQTAAEADENDLSLKEDCKRINVLVRASALKDLGDDEYKQGHYEKALNFFEQALEIDANYISALSNKSACHFALAKPELAKVDCTRALRLLGFESTREKHDMPSGFVPKMGSLKWKGGVCKLLDRRAKCHYQEKDYENMVKDLQSGFDLMPDSEAFAEQLCRAKLLCTQQYITKEVIVYKWKG